MLKDTKKQGYKGSIVILTRSASVYVKILETETGVDGLKMAEISAKRTDMGIVPIRYVQESKQM